MKKIVFLFAFLLSFGLACAADVGKLQPTVQTEQVSVMQHFFVSDYSFVSQTTPVVAVHTVMIKPQTTNIVSLLPDRGNLWIDPGRDAYLAFINNTQISKLKVSIMSLSHLNRMSLSRICGNEFKMADKKYYFKAIILTRHVTFS